MSNAPSFENLTRIPDVPFLPWLRKNKLKAPDSLELPEKANLAQGMEALYKADARIEFFQVLTTALPHRQSVWFACLCARDLLADPEQKTAALIAAEAWVFKPTIKSREAVEKAIEASSSDDDTVLAADAAFHGMAPGLEDFVLSPPNACPAMVFATTLKSLFADKAPEAIELRWALLAARGVNIASGGNGKIDE